MLQDRRWPEICEAIGQPELEHDERFASRSGRLGDHRQELTAILEEAFAQRPAAEWLRRLSERGVFCARVQDYEELSHDPQVIANGYIVEVERPDGPPVRMVAVPQALSAMLRGHSPCSCIWRSTSRLADFQPSSQAAGVGRARLSTE